jgi:hypothetical protein
MQTRELDNNHHEMCASAGLDATAMCKSAHHPQAIGLPAGLV